MGKQERMNSPARYFAEKHEKHSVCQLFRPSKHRTFNNRQDGWMQAYATAIRAGHALLGWLCPLSFAWQDRYAGVGTDSVLGVGARVGWLRLSKMPSS